MPKKSDRDGRPKDDVAASSDPRKPTKEERLSRPQEKIPKEKTSQESKDLPQDERQIEKKTSTKEPKSATKKKQEKKHEEEEEEEESWDDDFDAEEEEDDYEEDKDEDDEDDEDDDSLVNVDFSFVNPQPDDYHQVKQFLKNYLDNKEFMSSELTDMIINQVMVGTVLKSEDNVFGITTVLNMHRYKKTAPMKQIKAHLMEMAPNDQARSGLKKLFEDESKGLGLIISERVLNCPPQISLPLLKGLFDEIGWAQEDEKTEELRNSFKFDNYIILGTYHVELSEEEGMEKMEMAGPSKKKKKTLESKQAEEKMFWPKIEEEVMLKHAQLQFSYRVPQSLTDYVPTFEGFSMPHRCCMVISHQKQKTLLHELASLVGPVPDLDLS